MLTKRSFMTAATRSSSNDSRSITWHQWQEEYPIDRKIGRSSSFARPRASSPQAYQSTGLRACCLRYGLVSRASRFSRAVVDMRTQDYRSGRTGARIARRAIPGRNPPALAQTRPAVALWATANSWTTGAQRRAAARCADFEPRHAREMAVAE